MKKVQGNLHLLLCVMVNARGSVNTCVKKGPEITSQVLSFPLFCCFEFFIVRFSHGLTSGVY